MTSVSNSGKKKGRGRGIKQRTSLFNPDVIPLIKPSAGMIHSLAIIIVKSAVIVHLFYFHHHSTKKMGVTHIKAKNQHFAQLVKF